MTHDRQRKARLPKAHEIYEVLYGCRARVRLNYFELSNLVEAYSQHIRSVTATNSLLEKLVRNLRRQTAKGRQRLLKKFRAVKFS